MPKNYVGLTGGSQSTYVEHLHHVRHVLCKLFHSQQHSEEKQRGNPHLSEIYQLRYDYKVSGTRIESSTRVSPKIQSVTYKNCNSG